MRKNLVGTTQANAIWALAVREEDNIYLFNFKTGVIRGPYKAISTTDCHDPSAWSGKFPIQAGELPFRTLQRREKLPSEIAF